MRRLALVTFCLAAACGGIDAPDGASDSGRFLLVEPSVAPECGTTVAVPPAGEMPDLERLGDADAWLFELPDELGAASAVTVYKLRDDVARWGTGFEVPPTPTKVWHWTGDGFNEVSVDETAPLIESYRLVPDGTCSDVVQSLCDMDAVTPCDRFERYDVLVPGTSAGIGVGLALDETTVLVSAADVTFDDEPAEFFRVSETSIERVTNTSTMTPFGGGFRTDDGQVWLYGPLGRFAKYTNGSFELQTPPAYQSGFFQSWLDGARDGAPFEMFALTDGGAFERFDGTSWEIVRDGFELLEHEGGVAWLGPSHAISIGSVRKGVIRYRDGVVTEEFLDSVGLTERLSAIANVPGIGAMVGSIAGEIFVDDGTGWKKFEEGPRDGLEVNGLLPYRGGFVFGREIAGLEGGWAVQYVPGFGLCPAERVSEADLRRITRMGERSFVVVGEEVGLNSWVSIVRGAPSAPRCE